LNSFINILYGVSRLNKTNTMSNRLFFLMLFTITAAIACNNDNRKVAEQHNGTELSTDTLRPVYITDSTLHDTDDPAIWINRSDAAKSLVLGTDKDSDGGLYAYDLEGKIVNKVPGLKRPNNVDIAYGLMLNGKPTDIAVLTERETNSIRIYSLPNLQPIDNGGIPVFENDSMRAPMGIALYTNIDKQIFAIVGRKDGPKDGYLWQYKLEDNGKGIVKATVVRRFGKYSGKKEIESIAVDNELGFVYYSDEQHGVHKYYADPAKGNEELALFSQQGFTSDHEGISIYKNSATTGYILVSNQQKNSFMVYPREGSKGQIHQHDLITEIQVSTDESDGSDVVSLPLNAQFPNGLFVAMSNGRVFQYYDWCNFQRKIDEAIKQK